MTQDSPFVSIEEVAKYFGVSVSTIRVWVRKKEIPTDTYIKVGRTYRFHLAQLTAAMTAAPKQLELDFNHDEEK